MAEEDTHSVTCPHCNRPFAAELLGSEAERHQGFKCPHCRLFVPLHRSAATPPRGVGSRG